jgi:hypothetical protein
MFYATRKDKPSLLETIQVRFFFFELQSQMFLKTPKKKDASHLKARS